MIKAKYVMCTKSSVAKDATGRDIVYKLMATGCPGLPVVGEKSEILGMVTMCDILRAADREGAAVNNLTAEQVMSKVTVTADPDASTEEISKMMVENNHAVIPIVKGKTLMGVISGREIVSTYVEPHLYTSFQK